MQVTVLNIPRDLEVSTITLSNDRDDPTRVKMMHCMDCGEKVTQYMGNIYRVIPGGLPLNILESTAHVIVHCSRCKKKYLIAGIV